MALAQRSAVIASILLLSCLALACSGTSTTSPETSTTVSTTSTIPATSTTLVVVTSPTWFSTPSGNISCALRQETARCDIAQRAWSPPARPADCVFDWGPTLLVGPSGDGRFGCVSDTVYRPDVVVPYGRSVRDGTTACDVLPEGVTCRAASGHGFFVSAESYRLF